MVFLEIFSTRSHVPPLLLYVKGVMYRALFQETSLAKNVPETRVGRGVPGTSFLLKQQMLGFASFDEAPHAERR